MTDLFNYDDMTWPEVADLPRDVPLILSLGSFTGWERVAAEIGNPARLGILPSFPFGFPGSGLEVEPTLLAAYVDNLLNSLRDDGFTKVYALTQNTGDSRLEIRESLQTTQSQVSSSGLDTADEHRLLDHRQLPITNPQLPIPSDSQREKVILLPIGHTEQHGFHLPLSVDTIIINAIAQGTAARVPELAYAMPVMPYGVSTHRSSFAATMNAGGRAFEDFWLGVIDSLVARGFNRFYLMSGHGGNGSFLVNIVKYAGERHRRIFCATAFLHTSGHIGGPAIEKYRTSKIGGMGHAGELETSYMLHLRPDLCHMQRVVDETDFVATPNYYMDWIEGGSLIANPPWDDDTKTGAYGAGSHATAEKGRLWLEAAVEEKAVHVAEIHEQHRRREERRNAGYGLWGKK